MTKVFWYALAGMFSFFLLSIIIGIIREKLRYQRHTVFDQFVKVTAVMGLLLLVSALTMAALY